MVKPFRDVLMAGAPDEHARPVESGADAAGSLAVLRAPLGLGS